MKITKDQLMQIILEELSPQRFQEATSFQDVQQTEDDIASMTSVVMTGIMTGMLTQTGETLDEDEERDYRTQLYSIFKNNMPVTTALAEIFSKLRAGGFEVDEPESMSPESDEDPIGDDDWDDDDDEDRGTWGGRGWL